ncbi:MAG: hypothetical protein R3F11_27975 [Verrucomicrobiales bacterium]
MFGLTGRRECRRIFPRATPPVIRLDRNSGVIGYCQFTKENDPRPWQTEPLPWGGAHDDYRVYQYFGSERSVALPFACYHLGDVSRNWGGYQGVSKLGEAAEPGERGPVGFGSVLAGKAVMVLGTGIVEDTLAVAEAVGAGDPRGCVLGNDAWEMDQFPVGRVEDLPVRLTGIAGWLPGKWAACRRRMLRGEPALPLAECVNPLFLKLIEADRRYTRERFEREVEAVKVPAAGARDGAAAEQGLLSAGRVKILGEGGRDPFAEVEDGGLDAVWLAGEIGYTPLLEDVPRWRRKFPGGEGMVCGGFRDVEFWPESTACIEMLLGTPEVVTVEGEWLFRVSGSKFEVQSSEDGGWVGAEDPPPSFPLPIPLERAESELAWEAELGIVFYQNDRGVGTVEGLIRSLHSLRGHWRGAAAVLFSGDESPSVRIACARYQALYREVPEPEPDGDPRVARRSYVDPEKQVREWTPYRHTLWVGLRARQVRSWSARRSGSPGRQKSAATRGGW